MRSTKLSSKQKNCCQNGFTMIELVIVLVIVGALLSVVYIAHNGVIRDNNDKQREADIQTVQGALEGYYAQNSLYPTLSDLNNQSWVTKHLNDLPSGSLQDPSWSASADCTSNGHSILINKSEPNCYSYQVISTDGSSCNDTSQLCAHYTLTAVLNGGIKYVKSSLN